MKVPTMVKPEYVFINIFTGGSVLPLQNVDFKVKFPYFKL